MRWSQPGYHRWFNDPDYTLRVLLDRSYFSDFTGALARTIVSEKAKQVMIDNKVSKVGFADVQMVSVNDLTEMQKKKLRQDYGDHFVKRLAQNPPQYYRLYLNIGAELDFEKTNIKLMIDCSECGRKSYETPGLGCLHNETPHIIESTWKGFDIFIVEGLGNAEFCTQRFVDIYNQNKLTGLIFKPVPVV